MIEIEKIVPHDAPMILIDELVDYQKDCIHVRLKIRPNSPFATKEGVPSYVGIEYMAQAIAAWNGYRAHLENTSPQVGFLLGSRNLNLHTDMFLIDQKLDVFGRCKYNDGEMASFECWIENCGEKLAEANLNVYQPKDLKQFNMDTD